MMDSEESFRGGTIQCTSLMINLSMYICLCVQYTSCKLCGVFTCILSFMYAQNNL